MWWDRICDNYRGLWRPAGEHPDQNSPKQNSLKRERGQSLVEFALIVPVLLMVVLGTVDLGMGFKTYIALTNAAREGARWISIYPSDQEGAEARIRTEASVVGLSDDVLAEHFYTSTFTPGGPYVAGDKVEVSVEHEYELLFGALTGLPTIEFTASSTMVVLYDK